MSANTQEEAWEDEPAVDDTTGEILDSDAEQPHEDERPLAFPNAEAWVNEWALPHYRRRLNAEGFRWDPQWWAYEEAGTVLEGLWETWEQMRWEGATGIPTFFRDYFYPLMGQLTSPDGPFWAYDAPKVTEPPEQWPTVQAPPGWFHDAEDEADD